MSIFQDVLVKKPGRSLFNLRHERKFSADWAWLYPIMCIETVPGDTFRLSTEVLVRTAPLIAPIMHRVNVKVNYFFVPNRLLWSEWQDFITGINQSATYEPTDPSSYFVTKIPPYIAADSTFNTVQTGLGKRLLEDGSLADFLGFPTHRPNTNINGTVNVQLLPFRAYQKIYNDWYRNQNVEAQGWKENYQGLLGGLVTTYREQTLTLRKRMWEKDYFTSALPFAQRGDATPIPLANGGIEYVPTGTTKVKDIYGNPLPDTSDTDLLVTFNHGAGPSEFTQVSSSGVSGNIALNFDNSSNLKANITIGTINDLRTATRLQRWLEINARVGGRYIEQILGHFGIKSSDSRLQRAEYLGGWSAPIVVSDVEQTNSSSASVASGQTMTPQGTLAGKGTSYNNSKPIKCFCEEHGFIIGIMSIMPRTAYQDGLPRMFNRIYKEDYYFPEFANLGEQDIKKSEVYFPIASARTWADDRFGFQERYCEYKYIPSTVHGEFKNNLQFWHLGRAFNSEPALNKSFVECNPRNNVFAVESGVSHFYVNLINDIRAMRPMPRQAIPSL